MRPLPPRPDDRLPPAFEAEVQRINDRYVHEIVERFKICPFARAGREKGRIVRGVFAQRDAALEPALAWLEQLEATAPEAVEMGIAVYPRFDGDLLAFRRYARALIAAHTERFGPQRAFVGVVFHPDWKLVPTSPASLVPWLRRSPDPTLQWTRRSTLAQIRRPLPPGPFGDRGLVRTDAESRVSSRVAAANFAFVTREGGRERIEGILADILADRTRSYAPWMPGQR
ncbi:MAG: DUF1415 family protein [Planctomycetota bacterium]|nr:MAG: DUF1415 family protein [Planctomycetota bacterium]